MQEKGICMMSFLFLAVGGGGCPLSVCRFSGFRHPELTRWIWSEALIYTSSSFRSAGGADSECIREPQVPLNLVQMPYLQCAQKQPGFIDNVMYIIVIFITVMQITIRNKNTANSPQKNTEWHLTTVVEMRPLSNVVMLPEYL